MDENIQAAMGLECLESKVVINHQNKNDPRQDNNQVMDKHNEHNH